MRSLHHRIAVIPGDGVGREVVPAAIAVLEVVGLWGAKTRHGALTTLSSDLMRLVRIR